MVLGGFCHDVPAGDTSAFYSRQSTAISGKLPARNVWRGANGVVQATTTTAILAGTFVFSITFEMYLADVIFSTKQDVLLAIKATGWFLIAGALCGVDAVLPSAERP